MKYPIGIQSFSQIREEGYKYVDKTRFVYRLANYGAYYFLSRPRRFGKSLLLSTLEAYFMGRKELFEGLEIERLQKDPWPENVPIFRLDLSPNDYSDYSKLEGMLNDLLKNWEMIYGKSESESSYELRFGGVVKRAHAKTGQRVVILIDEYDSPIISNLHNPELSERMRNLLKGFYTNIKAQGEHIRFAFITGVSRFSKVTIFSGINNLNDISLSERYSAICGITEEELEGSFKEGIEALSEKQNQSYSETLDRLRAEYDGYLFSEDGVKVYNPFSVLNCLNDLSYKPYWYATGTPAFLLKMLEKENWDLYQLVNKPVSAKTLGDIESYRTKPVSILFQTGYLTIKSYDRDDDLYTLDFPNREVRDGFIKGLLPLYTKQPDISDDFRVRGFVKSIRDGDVDTMMEYLNSLFANIPYDDAVKEEMDVRNIFVAVLYLTVGYIHTEIHTHKGRIDILIRTDKYLYIIELKYNRSVSEALKQIEEREYAKPFQLDGRQLIRLGINFNPATRSLEWGLDQ